MTTINDKWIDFAIRLQSIAQAGLQYGKDKYDIERYEEIRRIAAEMISAKTNISAEKVYNLFCNETGYQTPKVDTRAAVFVDGKILLVHENNGTKSERLIAVQDWRKHNVTNYAYGVIKIFVQCKYVCGEFEKNIETTEIGFFGKDEIPENLAVEKCTREQVLMCFEAYENPKMPTSFD